MASASSSNANASWMPAAGRHRVEIGSSLARALKSRKLLNNNGGAEAPPVANKRSHLPDKDFYTFRYYHKPPSVDPKKPGMIEFRKKDVTLELPSVQAGESTMFRGQETSLNKHECVLIYDEDTGTFTLEKLDACIQLTSDRNLPSIIPRNASPAPSNSARGPSNAYNNDASNIDQDILDLVDADPAPAPPTSSLKKKSAAAAAAPPPPPPRKKEEEEEGEAEEDDFPIPNRKRAVSPARPAPALSSKPPSRPIKPLPKSVVPKPTVPPVAAAASSSASSSRLPAPPAEAALPPRPKSSVPLPGNKGKQQKQPPAQRVPPPTAAKDEHIGESIPPAKAAPVRPQQAARPVAKPPTRQQPPAPPPPPSAAPLALPGSSSVLPTLPSALPGSRPMGGKARVEPPAAAAAVPPPLQAPVEVMSDSDDDEFGWDEIATGDAAGGPAQDELSMLEAEIFGDTGGGDGGGGDEMGDDDDFHRQLELEMEMADIGGGE
ncbi:hypothetical protein H1R20_g4621, partial [Candolleomyces eurysporus]